MNRYEVVIKLTDGNEIHAKVVARDQAHALRRIDELPQVAEFAGSADIEKIDVKLIAFEEITDGRFLLQRSEHLGKWVCTDVVNKFVVIFEEGEYNETSKITPLEDFNPDDYMKIAQWMRETGEWLMENHEELL